MKYKVHRLDVNLNSDEEKIQDFLNSLNGEVVSVIHNVAFKAFWIHKINFILIIEKVN